MNAIKSSRRQDIVFACAKMSLIPNNLNESYHSAKRRKYSPVTRRYYHFMQEIPNLLICYSHAMRSEEYAFNYWYESSKEYGFLTPDP